MVRLPDQGIPDYKAIINEINDDTIKNHINFFSSLGSRFTGYDGCNIAAQYIFEKFKNYGLTDVRLEPFNVTVPVDYGANITILTPSPHTIKAYSLLPNSVQTCSTLESGISGRLVFGGSGLLKELNGKEVNGSIVLMKFNSQRNWLNVVKMGARAIIFMAPEYTTNVEASMKTLNVPLNVPRLYVTEEDGAFLLSLLSKGNVTLEVKSRMEYEIRIGYNVVGIVKGTPINETVAVTAHYDSFSYIPALAPGADDSCGISVLLELARYLSLHPPKRTIMFIAYSGFWQGLYGSREFLDKHWDECATDIKAFFNFDFSTDSDAIGLPCIAYWYNWLEHAWDVGPQDRAKQNVDNIRRIYLPEIERQLDIKINVDWRTLETDWELTIPTAFMLDTEPIMMAGGLGINFRTVHSMREVWGTPFDTYERIKYQNLRPQMIFSICSFISFVNEDRPLITYDINRIAQYDGFPTLIGHIVEYNASSGWYNPVSDAIVHISLATTIQSLIIKTDKNGVFTIKGAVHPFMPNWGARYVYTAYAYKIDSATGEIIYATDMGMYGSGKFPNNFYVQETSQHKYLVVFQCGVIVTFDSLNPQYFMRQIENLEVRLFPTHVTPEHFGIITDSASQISMFFVPPDEHVEIISKDRNYFPIMILMNASERYPEGEGFTVKAGTTYYIYDTVSKAAWDLHYLNSFRLKNAENYGVRDLEALNVNEQAAKDLMDSQRAYREGQYDIAYYKAFTAWQQEVKIYRSVYNLINDSSSAVTIIFALLLPFSFIFERLAFSFVRRRAIAIIAILLACLVILYLARLPAFYLATSAPMSLLGTFIVGLQIPIATILIGYALSFFKTVRKKILGVHFVEIKRMDKIMISLSVGVSNMRKRKLRTSMIILTLIIITWSMVSFTSMSPYTISRTLVKSGTTLYNGILVRRIVWDYFTPQILDFVSCLTEEGAVVSFRFWLFPLQRTLIISSNQTTINLQQNTAILGMAPSERYVTNIDIILSRGRWFEEFDLKTCIISEWLAKRLSVNVSDIISMAGIQLQVVGIFDENILSSLLDLDGYPLVPIVYYGATEEAPAGGGATRIDVNPSDRTIIIPDELAKLLGSNVYTVAVKFLDPTNIEKHAEKLALYTGLDVYAGINGTIRIYRQAQVISTRGWENIVVPFLVSMLIITSSMLAIINERRREIFILSSLGLSPADVMFMFAAEFITFAFVGAIIGYIVGVITNIALYHLNLMPSGFVMNASSTYVMTAIGLMMLSVLLPLPYTLHLGGKLVTPSMERAWKVPTKPLGDEWSIPTPFVLKDNLEARAMLLFLKEYCESHSTERTGTFIASDVSFLEREKILYLKMKARIIPFEAGILQEVEIRADPAERGEYKITIHLHRITGLLGIWSRSNRFFLDEIRQQFLLWKTGLSPEEKTRYENLARS